MPFSAILFYTEWEPNPENFNRTSSTMPASLDVEQNDKAAKVGVAVLRGHEDSPQCFGSLDLWLLPLNSFRVSDKM